MHSNEQGAQENYRNPSTLHINVSYSNVNLCHLRKQSYISLATQHASLALNFRRKYILAIIIDVVLDKAASYFWKPCVRHLLLSGCLVWRPSFTSVFGTCELRTRTGTPATLTEVFRDVPRYFQCPKYHSSYQSMLNFPI